MTPPVTLWKVPDDLPPLAEKLSVEEPAVIELELPRGSEHRGPGEVWMEQV
jgi:hypothetical protein